MRAASSACWALLVRGRRSPELSSLPDRPPPVLTHPASSAHNSTPPQRSTRMDSPLIQTLLEFSLTARSIQHLSLQLTAGGIDVVAAGATKHRESACIEQ